MLDHMITVPNHHTCFAYDVELYYIAGMQEKLTLTFRHFFYVVLFVLFNTPTLNASPHIHGEAALNVVQDDNRLVVSLVLSAIDVVGFEYSPKNKEQKLKVDRELSRFKEPKDIFTLSEAADCRLLDKVHISAGELLKQKKNSELQKKKHHHSHDKKKKHGDDEREPQSKSGRPSAHHEHSKSHHNDHSDIEVSYMYECKKASQLKELSLNLFKLYPAIKIIKAQFVSAERQMSLSLNATNNVLKFKK